MSKPSRRSAAPTPHLSVHEREAIKAVISAAVALLADDDVDIKLTDDARASIEESFARNIVRTTR